MIFGAHVILYSKNAEADRAYFRRAKAIPQRSRRGIPASGVCAAPSNRETEPNPSSSQRSTKVTFRKPSPFLE
jgi:hypothetical protein